MGRGLPTPVLRGDPHRQLPLPEEVHARCSTAMSVQGSECCAALWSVTLQYSVVDRMWVVVRVALFAPEQRGVNPLVRGGGEATRTIGGERWFGGAGLCFWIDGCRRDKLLEFREEGLASAPKLDLAELANPIQHAIGQGLFVGKRFEHALLDGFLRNEVDHRDRAGLVLAPGAGDALFEFRRVPGQIAVDDDTGVLQVQSGRPGVSAQKDAAGRVRLENVNLGAAALLRDRAGVPGEPQLEAAAQAAHEVEHPLPL